ncbi:MAG: aminomethyl-transferring glycine dehydrogenase subunit GcvPB [Deltaproteobacteria bacterium]|nr:aminomethyl-transferring glycine dehydrogenase subunit GcvPB [Deltaproteobacteria bacterium]
MKPDDAHGRSLDEPALFERGSSGRRGYTLPPLSAPERGVESLPAELCREDLPDFPELSEMEVLRHFLRLSQWNFSAATNFYPLGSCTMKYNPVLNERMARLGGFADLHPLTPPGAAQGALELMAELERLLAELSGMDAVSLQPAAGAHGELAGMKMIRAHHLDHGNPRRKVLIPRSAHGTNPASSALCGYQVVAVESNDRGMIDPAAVARLTDGETAAIMVTNPNTLGLFEKDIVRIAAAVHEKGGLVYLDGANMNALLGVAKPGHMGADVLQFNLHKTFSTPHGGGGPGAGPIAVRQRLADYLPVPRVVRAGGGYALSEEYAKSIGRVRAFYGNFGMLVRAYAYLLSLGGDGLRRATQMAILNANYVRKRLEDVLEIAYAEPCLHECVFSDSKLQPLGVKTLDLAKRLLDYGFYAPTIYFPLIVSGAIMIEPTESETRETLDEFIAAVRAIVAEAKEAPERVKSAPHTTRVSRLDEVRAARQPRLRWKP